MVMIKQFCVHSVKRYNGLYQLDQNFHSSIALAGSDLYDSGVAAVAGYILRCDLIEQLANNVSLLGILLAACQLLRNLSHVVKNL